jgi:hypothetical protein
VLGWQGAGGAAAESASVVTMRVANPGTQTAVLACSGSCKAVCLTASAFGIMF